MYIKTICYVYIVNIFLYKLNVNTVFVCIYTVPSTNIGTLDNYEQRRLWKYICIVYPFYLSLNKFTKYEPIIEVKQLKVGENLMIK